jgi:hypothetical protein
MNAHDGSTHYVETDGYYYYAAMQYGDCKEVWKKQRVHRSHTHTRTITITIDRHHYHYHYHIHTHTNTHTVALFHSSPLSPPFPSTPPHPLALFPHQPHSMIAPKTRLRSDDGSLWLSSRSQHYHLALAVAGVGLMGGCGKRRGGHQAPGRRLPPADDLQQVREAEGTLSRKMETA